jgi:uncharacterized protein YndB with AHSA1/START domain
MSDMTIRKSIRVERPRDVSFRVFCEDIGQWWPHGFGGEGSKMALEPRVGGRLYESRPDGSEYEIGRLTAYEPPAVVAFSWRAPSWDLAPRSKFPSLPEAPATLVELEHRGWEQNPKAAETQKNYSNGWVGILGHYQKHLTPTT